MFEPIIFISFFCGFITCLLICMFHIQHVYKKASKMLKSAIEHENSAISYMAHCEKMQEAMDKLENLGKKIMNRFKLLLIAIVVIILLFVATDVTAKTFEVHYPEKHCAEILSQEYSTGGGDSSVQILEILCKDSEGTYRGFVDSWSSVAGFLGAGRFTMPDTFLYIPSKSDIMKVK